MNNVQKELCSINTVKELYNFVFQLNAKEIGLLGGRRFIKGINSKKEHVNNGDVSLNDVIRKFAEVKIKKEDDHQFVLMTRRHIRALDDEANEKLAKNKNLFTRILTTLRSYFGSTGGVHRSVRDQILLKKADELPKDSKEKSQYLAEEIFYQTQKLFKTEEFWNVREHIFNYINAKVNEDDFLMYIGESKPQIKLNFLETLIAEFYRTGDKILSKNLFILLNVAYMNLNENAVNRLQEIWTSKGIDVKPTVLAEINDKYKAFKQQI